MTWWTKTKNFVVKYWQWFVFSIVSLAAFLLGYSKTRDWQIKATDSKKNFDKEREIINTLGQQQIEENLAHVEARDEAHENNVLSFEKKMKELKKEKIRRMLEESKTDPTAIDRFLEEKGIEEE